MFKVNDYFDGMVKSIAFEADGGAATVGVMAAGDYEFGTTQLEVMTVITGALSVLLPGETEWRKVGKGETFAVPANSKFQVKATKDSSYLCLYR